MREGRARVTAPLPLTQTHTHTHVCVCVCVCVRVFGPGRTILKRETRMGPGPRGHVWPQYELQFCIHSA